MAALRHHLILLMAIMDTTITVAGARPLSTNEEAKIATFFSKPNLDCAHNTLVIKATAITRDKIINTIDRLERDLFVKSAFEEGNTITLDRRESDPKRAILPPFAAMTMPALTSANSPDLLEHLGVPPDSDMATAIAIAAYLCGYGALPREMMACAASADAIAAFVTNEFAC